MPPPPASPPRTAQPSPDWAAHVAADAGYIPPPSAPPPPPDLHPAEYAPSAAEYVPAAYEHEGGYYPNTPASEAEHHDFYDDVPPRRRMGILAIAAVFALAVIGTAGAFGYRALFGSSSPSGPPPVIKADTAPTKVIPVKKSADAKNGKLIYDRVADHGQGEKLVSREEQPVDIDHKSAGVVLPHDQNGMPSGSIQPPLGSGVVGGAAKKIHTIAIRPDGTAVANAEPSAPVAAPPAPPMAMNPAPAPTPPPPPRETQHEVQPAPSASAAPMAPHAAAAKPQPAPAPRHTTTARSEPPARRHEAAPRNAPLSLNPNAPASARAEHRPMRTATAAPTQIAPAQAARTPRAAPSRTAPAAHSGGYAVQVASRHNEADAKASLHSLQAKFGQQLGGHQTLIRRVDLGAKGVYYRALVGPFANSEAASQMCSKLKAAGGNCFVQRI